MPITAAKLMVVVGADTDDATKKLHEVTGNLNGFARSAQETGKKLTAFVTAPLLGIGVAATKMAVDYERNMNVLRVQSGATGEEIERLSELAEALGRDMTLPGTSASDAAEAMLELSKAGLTVEDTMDAARGVLQLSAAAQTSNARAAEIAANALNAFHLEGSEATRVADLLAASANASSGEVTDMADALQMASAVAYSAGVPIEDVATAISLMANAGIQGSDAGTSFKQMLLSLMGPTDKAKNLMADLGIAIYDASGNMLPMEQLISNVNQALSGLSQEQRNAALATIFGSDAVRAANVVLLGGVDAWGAMEAAVTRGGAAADLAGAQMEGLPGAIESVRNALETAMLSGIQPFTDEISDLALTVAEAANAFSELPEGTQETVVEILALTAAIGPATWALGTFITSLHTVTGALIGLPVFLADVGAGFALIRGGAGAMAVATTGAAGLTAALLPLTAAVAAVGAAWYAWNQNIAETNRAGQEAVSGVWQQFFADQIRSGRDATQITDEYLAAQQRVKEGLESTNPVLRMFVQDQDDLVANNEELTKTLLTASGSYEELEANLRRVAQAQGMVIDEQGNLTKALSGSGLAGSQVVTVDFLPSRTEFDRWASDIELDDKIAGRTRLIGDLSDAEREAAAAAEAMGLAQGDAGQAMIDAENILEALNAALSESGWETEAASQASQQMAVSLGLMSAAEAQLENDVNLVTTAFAEHVIGLEELTAYLGDAADGTLELTDAERNSLQTQTDYAQALRENAKAAQEAAIGHLNLAQSLKDASDAQIAQAAINGLTEALRNNQIGLPDYISAVTGIQDTFGLADEKSRALAEGIGYLLESLSNGVLPAQNFDEALQYLNDDAEDGKTDLHNLVQEFVAAEQPIRTAEDALEDAWKQMQIFGEDAVTTSDNVEDAFTGKDWHGVGLSIADGVAQGIEDGKSEVVVSAEAAAEAAILAWKLKLKINSPSDRAADEIGAMLDAGVAKGVRENISMPVQAIAEASEETISEIDSGAWRTTQTQPPETIEQTMATAIQELQRQASGLFGAEGQPIEINLILDGEVIERVAVNAVRREL